MEDFIPTRCARINKSVQKNFQSIEYKAYKKKTEEKNVTSEKLMKHNKDDNQEKSIDPKKQQEQEMKRARYDVIKFGMSGFGKVELHKAKVAAAIALGARPPKNKKTNYKKLKEERIKSKNAIKKKILVSGADMSLVKLRRAGKKKNNHNNKNKKESGILGVYGKVARGITKKS